MKRLGIILSSAAVLIVSQEYPAHAQEEEIIVTARKRQESLLKVPVVEQVISQASLEQYGTQDLYAVTARVPGVLIGASIGAIGQQISIRGIGTTAQNPTIDQSVSLNIDGLQLSQSLAYGAGMFDIGVLEVLKGPQALFYGKNSPAGVISLRSADPTAKAEVITRAGYEYEAREKFGEFVLSGPVTNSLLARLAVRYSDSEGYFKNDVVAAAGTGTQLNSFSRYAPDDNLIVRGTILFEPSTAYNARIKLNYTEDKITGGGFGAQTGYCPDGTGGVAPLQIAFLSGDNCKVDRNISIPWLGSGFPLAVNGGVPFSNTYQRFGTLEQNLRIGDALTLTSVTGYYRLAQKFQLAASTVTNTLPLALQNRFKNEQSTEELRLASDFKDSLVNFLVGGFYQGGKQVHEPWLMTNTTLGLPATLQHALHTIDIRSLSVFGQTIWNLSPQWELSGGARWTHEKRNHAETNFNPGNGTLGKLALIDPVIKASNLSPEASITYKPTDDLTLFASYKQGFKSGSFNTVQFVPASTRASFGDESVKGFEGGLKSRLFDHRMRVNVAAYRYTYRGLQVGANEKAPDGSIAIRTLNAASARVYGVDLDASYRPVGIDGLTLNSAVNYNHSRYLKFINAPCSGGQTIAEGCNLLLNAVTNRYTAQDLSGKVLVRAPAWIAVVGADYEAPLRNGMILSLGGSGNFTSRYSTALIDQAGFFQRSFFKLNANIALASATGNWKVSLIGNNLTNKVVSSGCSNTNTQSGSLFGGQIAGSTTKGPARDDESSCIAERGRYLALRVSYSFVN